jgi:hypothetical protein
MITSSQTEASWDACPEIRALFATDVSRTCLLGEIVKECHDLFLPLLALLALLHRGEGSEHFLRLCLSCIPEPSYTEGEYLCLKSMATDVVACLKQPRLLLNTEALYHAYTNIVVRLGDFVDLFVDLCDFNRRLQPLFVPFTTSAFLRYILDHLAQAIRSFRARV